MSKSKSMSAPPADHEYSSVNSLALTPPTSLAVSVVSEAEKAFLDESKELPQGPTKIPHISLDHKSAQFVMPDGMIVDGAEGITGFIISHFTMRAYYKSGYDPKAQKGPPDCRSKDCVEPDADIVNPPSKMCATCPNNQFGSAGTLRAGAKGKACREKLFLIMVNPTFGTPPVAALILPPTGIGKFYGGAMMVGGKRGYLDQLKARHRAWQIVWSRVTLARADKDDIHCQVDFTCGEPASADVARQLAQIVNQFVKPIEQMRASGHVEPEAEPAAV